MAVTRINNNQISSASTGNAAAGIDASTKLQDYTVTAGKLANNITYASNFTITGNLQVQGNTTQIDTDIVTVEDPLIILASNQAGAPALDIGFIGQRGTSENIAFVWEESANAFVTAFTTTAESNTTITVTSYADLKTHNANVTGTLQVVGTTSLVGNIISGANIDGNVNAANLLTSGQVSATGNVTGANVLTSGEVSATGNVTGANLNIGPVSILNAGNITGLTTLSANANVTTTGNLSGNAVYSDHYFYANGAPISSASAGANTEIQISDGLGGFVASASFTYDYAAGANLLTAGNISSTGTVVATGNISGANLTSSALTSGRVTYATTGGLLTDSTNLTTDGSNVTLGGGDLSVVGNVNVSGSTANISTSGNVTSGAQISATGNVAGNNVNVTNALDVGTTATITGNIIANTLTGASVSIWSSTGGLDIELAGNGNVNVNAAHINNLSDPVGALDAANKQYVDAVASGLDLKASVDVATTGPLANETEVTTVTYNNGTAGVGATLTIVTTSQLLFDNVDLSTLGANARVLVKNEADPATGTSDAAWNGIYVVTSTSSLLTVLTRSTDFDDEGTLGSIPGAFTFDIGGGTQSGTGWVCITQNPIVMGTTPILWAQFSGGGTYSGGNAIDISGTVISAKFDNSTIGVNGSNQLYIPANAPLVTPNIGNATGSSLSVTGNVTGEYVIANVDLSAIGNVVTTGSVNTANLSLTGNVLSTLNVTGNVVANNVNTVNDVVAGNVVSAVGNIVGANVTTGGLISATGNIDSGNVVNAVTVSATGNVIGGNVNTAGNVSSTGNIIAAYFYGDGSNITNLTAGTRIVNGTSNVEIATANGNVTFGVAGTGNVIVVSATDTGVTGNVSASGNVVATTGVSGNTVTGTTSGTFGNVTIIGSAIESTANAIYINGANNALDFVVNGTADNVFYVNGTTNTVSIGSNVQTTDAILSLNATTSFLVPVGNTAQRPATGVTGMQRFNTSTGFLEIYDGAAWTVVGGEPTVINDQQFSGDGVTTAFTLSSTQTTNSCLVSINGVVQVPTIAYSVVGTTLTFTEAPAVGDHIDVREITTTQTVTGISNTSGNAVISVNDAAANVNVTGNLVVNGGTGFVYGDGTYLTNVGGGNVTATKISQGTSQANFTGAGGEFYVAVGGANIINTASGALNLTGDLIPSANATYNLGSATNQWNALYVKGTTIYIGDGTITSNASGVTLTNAGGGSFTVGGTTAGAGNISGGNVIATGVISTTGTVKGLLLSSTGNVTASANVNATNINITGTIDSGNVTSVNISATGNISAAGNVTGSIYLGNVVSVIGNVSGANFFASDVVSATGNVTGANLFTGGAVSAAGNVTANEFNGNVVSVVGNITGSTLNIGSIVNTGSNGAGNIGSASKYFNTVFAMATSAQYADLAEKYTADAEYAPGTVVAFGGDAEVTASSANGDRRVAGVVSTNPSYIMNGGLEGANVVTVALTGRVPCRVTGTVRKGDLMVSNGDGTARAEENPSVGSVIGKALENFDGSTGTIEVVVGRV